LIRRIDITAAESEAIGIPDSRSKVLQTNRRPRKEGRLEKLDGDSGGGVGIVPNVNVSLCVGG
jgi:hypothetical protein